VEVLGKYVLGGPAALSEHIVWWGGLAQGSLRSEVPEERPIDSDPKIDYIRVGKGSPGRVYGM
jgi:hypothetical protein